MITIVEGADATGKTTYAKKLAEQRNSLYLHSEKPKAKIWYQEYIHRIASTDMVLDRWHLGEVVWPYIYKRNSLFDENSFDQCNWELAKLGTELILLTRPEDEIIKEMMGRGESEQINDVIKSRFLFIEVFKQVKYLNKRIVDSGAVQCM
jgi:thymidylate kinase